MLHTHKCWVYSLIHTITFLWICTIITWKRLALEWNLLSSSRFTKVHIHAHALTHLNTISIYLCNDNICTTNVAMEYGTVCVIALRLSKRRPIVPLYRFYRTEWKEMASFGFRISILFLCTLCACACAMCVTFFPFSFCISLKWFRFTITIMGYNQ